MDAQRTVATELVIGGGLVLVPGEGLRPADVAIDNGIILEVTGKASYAGARRIDAGGCLVLPGIVDLHGDAFERQIMPRPRTLFPLEIATRETDRQLAANGITTAYHGITVSWEPGLRSLEQSLRVIAALDAADESLLVDNRLHIRWETFAVDEVVAVVGLLRRAKKPLLAFNDHTTPTLLGERKERKIAQSAERAMVGAEEYNALLDQQKHRADEVETAVEILSQVARDMGIMLLAHDETTPDMRRYYRSLGVTISEFPMNWETAGDAAAAGEHIVFGAPNVVRGGSHNGAISATEAIARKACTILASDYYYPAPFHAAFRLADENILPFEAAWNLVSAAPAAAANLTDRGSLLPGLRADLLIVDPAQRRILTTLSNGRLAYQSA